ncbi:IER3IP1 [Cordylochernes scorpioides]|uniref:Immediate early response 3-interacting protein 1 n=1 Tax=Cordylochernes scorpioides TaxID=51811 RepID=A0ABY6KWE0_9ARAC|nr:IER3IP1 [Cordylochernes scorpioides]
MAFTLYNLYQAILLCVNAVAVLHEERFLAKVGLPLSSAPSLNDKGILLHPVMMVVKSQALQACYPNMIE